MLKNDRFIELCKLAGLNIVMRQESTLWEEVYARLPYQSSFYSESNINYQLAYQRGQGGNWEDFSCIIFLDKKPISLWPVTISNKNSEVNLTSQGRELLPPIFIKDCTRKVMKAINSLALKISKEISFKIGLQKLISAPAFDGLNTLNNWHTLLMMSGAECHSQHNLYVDLSLPLKKIKSFFRDRYKSLVTVGERIWNVEVLTNFIDAKVWEEFRTLHFAASGRMTRSNETWDLQYQSVIKGESFLVTARNETSRMIGAGLFVTTRDEGLYSVGAYDRNLFDKPIGHVIQSRAIQEIKKRGCRWYFLGQRFYPTDEPAPSKKELSVSHFKEGFATHCFVRFRLIKEI
jgi:FemAB family protein